MAQARCSCVASIIGFRQRKSRDGSDQSQPPPCRRRSATKQWTILSVPYKYICITPHSVHAQRSMYVHMYICMYNVLVICTALQITFSPLCPSSTTAPKATQAWREWLLRRLEAYLVRTYRRRTVYGLPTGRLSSRLGKMGAQSRGYLKISRPGEIVPPPPAFRLFLLSRCWPTPVRQPRRCSRHYHPEKRSFMSNKQALQCDG